MKAHRFDYVRPTRLEHAIEVLAEHGDQAKIIAGGQSLVPMLAFRLATPRFLVDIGRLPDLNRITTDNGGIRIGALVRWRDIECSAELKLAHPLLVEAIRHVAHYQIRNRGTVGGSLAHADPAAELPGLALTCGAEILVVGQHGQRTIPADEFFIGPLSTSLRQDELIVELRLPPWRAGRRWAFEEFSRRRGDFALAGVALFYDTQQNGHTESIQIGAIGVADTPIRLIAAESVVRGNVITDAVVREAGTAAAESVHPADDIHAPGEYRRALIGVLTERALARASGLSLQEHA